MLIPEACLRDSGNKRPNLGFAQIPYSMKILMEQDGVDESIYQDTFLRGHFNEFEQGPVHDDVVCPHGMICSQAEGEVVEEQHHTDTILLEDVFDRVFHYLPDLTVTRGLFESFPILCCSLGDLGILHVSRHPLRMKGIEPALMFVDNLTETFHQLSSPLR